jgi:hypothetical protein
MSKNQTTITYLHCKLNEYLLNRLESCKISSKKNVNIEEDQSPSFTAFGSRLLSFVFGYSDSKSIDVSGEVRNDSIIAF